MKISAALAAFVLVATPLASSSVRAQKPAHQHVLAAFATRRLIILPTHYLRMNDSLGWASQISDHDAYLSQLDAEIEFAFSDRGVKKVWVFPAALEAMAKRNQPYAPDPHGMAAAWLRFPGPKRLPEQLPDPLASQLRTLAALQEDGQLVFLPIELRFEPVAGGKECAVLRFAIFDAVRAKIIYMADVASDPQATFGPALAASLAGHLADQLGPPNE